MVQKEARGMKGTHERLIDWRGVILANGLVKFEVDEAHEHLVELEEGEQHFVVHVFHDLQ